MSILFRPLVFMRLYRFRKEVGMVWRGLRNRATPLHLKIATVLVALYLVSPVDLIPEVIPVLGLLDDLILVPLAVGWIAARLADAGIEPAPEARPA